MAFSLADANFGLLHTTPDQLEEYLFSFCIMSGGADDRFDVY